ncbi:MAG: hypothetical protein ACLRNQ_24145 [Flavonifractor plautii]
MTEQEKKRKFHRPMRLGLVAAAVAAMLVVTVSAANSEAIMTYLTSLRDSRGRRGGLGGFPGEYGGGDGRTVPPGGVPGGAGRPHHSDCGRSGDRCNPGADRPGGIPV